MKRRDFLLSLLTAGPVSAAYTGADELSAPLRIAAFQADVTPPLGSPVSLGNRPPARRIVDPLSARGMVLLGHGPPIVLCAVDWRFLLNEAHDAWREALAEAVGTSADRVAVHMVHNHDAVGVEYQLAAQKMRPDAFVCMAAYGDLGPVYVGTKAAYSQGGYEVGTSLVAPEVEDVLMAAMRDLLCAETTPRS